MAEIDWPMIESEYIQTKASMKTLAEKYSIPQATIRRHAAEREWTKKREQYRTKTIQKGLTRACAKESKKLAGLQTGASKICREMEKLTRDMGRELHRFEFQCYDSDTKRTHMQEQVLESVNAKKLLIMAQAFDKMTDAMRKLYDIQSKAESEQLAMARERLEMDKRKAAREEESNEITEIRVTMGAGMEDYLG